VTQLLDESLQRSGYNCCRGPLDILGVLMARLASWYWRSCHIWLRYLLCQQTPFHMHLWWPWLQKFVS